MIGILGGGLSGLALAHYLRKPCEVVERASVPGGLCRTYSDRGFSTDVGGHILFSRDDGLLAEMTSVLGPNVHERERVNRVLHHRQMVAYPFENGLGDLPPREAAACLLGAIQAKVAACIGTEAREENLEQWFRERFGDAMSEAYLLPYNEKLWKRPASELSTCWTRRIPLPPLADMVHAALKVPTVGYAHQARFRYPIMYGIEALTNAYAAGCRVRTDAEVVLVRGEPGHWLVECDIGEIERPVRAYQRLVSTIPLPELLWMLPNVPGEVQAAASKLEVLGVLVVNLHVKWKRKAPYTAVYVAEPEVPFHRVCWNENFSQSMAPQWHSSVSCEITWRKPEEWCRTTLDVRAEDVERGLRHLGLLEPEDEVVGAHQVVAPYGYVVPNLDYPEAVATVRAYVESRGIRLLGRFGRWDYLNMDQCVAGAHKLAKELGE